MFITMILDCSSFSESWFFFKTYLNGIISVSVQNNVNVIFTSYFAFTYVLVHIMILSKVLKHVIYLNYPPD